MASKYLKPEFVFMIAHSHREIIDESDVYIDVHKAIRRMAPAPKARSSHPHDEPLVHMPAPENALIDLSEPAEVVPVAKRAKTDSRAESPATLLSTSPKTTFMRRSSSAADGHLIAVRGNMTDMREHLKHLGPSNLASRPKTTRYNTVKIKNQPTRSSSVTDAPQYPHSVIEESYHDDPTLYGGEGEGLLKSAGREASDGVQALQQGYGSIPRGNSSNGGIDTVDGAGKTSPTFGKARNLSPDRRPISRHDSHNSNRSSDTLGSLHSGNHSPTHRKKGVARSGSITENIIEAGGVRKVVLETNSSSEGDLNEVRNVKKSPPPSQAQSQLDGQSDSQSHNDILQSEQVKKKRRRNRKKKSTKSDGGDDDTSAA